MIKRIIAGVVVVLALAGLGLAAVRFFAPATDAAISYAPKNSVFYANLFLKPSTSQRLALQDLVERFPSLGSSDEAIDALARLLDAGLDPMGLSFTDDVEPWLGKQIAFFVAPPPEAGTDIAVAGLIATKDNSAAAATAVKALEAARSAFSEASYRGHDHWRGAGIGGVATGVVGDFLVVGNTTGFRAVVDAAEGESLADSARYVEAESALTADRLALMYLDIGPLLDQLGVPGGLLPALREPTTAVVYARGDGLVLESRRGTAVSGSARDGLVLGDLPATSWAAASIEDFGGMVDSLIEGVAGSGIVGAPARVILESQFASLTGLDLRADILSWIGDAGVFLAGTDPARLGAGLVLNSSDADSSTVAVRKFELLLRRQGVSITKLDLEGPSAGFAVRPADRPEAFRVMVTDDAVLGTFGRAAAVQVLRSDRRLADEAGYGRAVEGLGEGFEPIAYLDFERLLQLVDVAGAGSNDVYDLEVRPFLDPLDFVVFGSKLQGRRQVQRVVIGVR